MRVESLMPAIFSVDIFSLLAGTAGKALIPVHGRLAS